MVSKVLAIVFGISVMVTTTCITIVADVVGVSEYPFLMIAVSGILADLVALWLVITQYDN